MDRIQRISGRSWAEIAADLGCSYATVYALRTGARHPSRKMERKIVDYACRWGVDGVEPPARLREPAEQYGEPDAWRREMDRRVSALEQAMVRLTADRSRP